MIRYYRRNQKLKLRSLEEFKPGSWVYVEAPDDKELEQLADKLRLDKGHLSDVLDENEMPRLEREDSQLYMFTRFPFTNDELRLETTPVLFVLGKDFLLTVAAVPLPRLEKFIDEKINFSTELPDQLMLKILNQIVEQFDAYLNQISRQIKSLRNRLRRESISNKDFVDFVLVEDELNEFLSALTPTNANLRRMLINKHLKLSETDKELIEDLMLANEQSIEMARSNNKSIVNIRDAYSTIMTNNLNTIIRILTVLTVVLSVLTFIAGLYGMNVKLPFDQNLHAFSIVVGGSILIVTILLWVFKRNKWM